MSPKVGGGVGLAVLLIAGCAVAGSSPAKKDADSAAGRAGIVMVQVPGLTSGQLISRVVGSNNTRTIQALEADPSKDKDAKIVLRITSTIDQGGFNGTDTVTRCYRYNFNAGYLDDQPHRVSCPDRPVVAPSPIPVDPSLPDDVQARVDKALGTLSPAAQLQPAAVRTALAKAFSGQAVRIDAVTAGSALGLSVGAGRYSCLFGRISGSAAAVTHETWIVPRVVAQPGELGCGARFAAIGDGKHPPH